MGSQTLEILRQGFLASLTGGWFFDVSHKTTFANAVHLYIYLFLLCSPFVTYMYSPALTAWVVYCIFVVVLIAALKVINLNMHGMYDRAQILSDPKASSGGVSHKTVVGDDEVGIEMQVLGDRVSTAEHRSEEISSAQSAISFEYQDPLSTTAGAVGGASSSAAGPSAAAMVPGTSNLGQMDFKVDVHRKNSSESSESLVYPQSGSGGVESSVVVTHSAEVCKNNPVAGTSADANPPGNGTKKDGGELNKLAQQRKKRKKTGVGGGGAQVTRESSSSSDSRNSSTLSSCGSSMTAGSCSSSSSSSSLYCTLRATGGGGDSSNNGGATTKSRSKGAKGGAAEAGGGDEANKSKRMKKRSPEAQNDSKERMQVIQAAPLLEDDDDSNQMELVAVGETSPGSKEKSSCSSGAKKKRFPSSRLQRQISLDTDEIDIREHLYFSMLNDDQRQRHRSTDSEETCTNTSNISLGNNNHHHHEYGIRPHLAYYTTKSELAIENIPGGKFPTTPMRKDSNSTMSAIQLPIATSSMATSNSCKIRRLSSGGGAKGKKGASGSGGGGGLPGSGGNGGVDSPGSNVRRIKSAALDTGNGASQTFVSTQPNSVEAIAGRSNNALPPPSKCLSRNPHLNLYPKKYSSHSSVAGGGGGGDQPVYPIAEHEVDEVVMGAGGNRIINHPLLNIRLPTSSSDSEAGDEDAEGAVGGGGGKKRIPKMIEAEIRLEIEESEDDDEGEDGESAVVNEDISDLECDTRGACGRAGAAGAGAGATTDSETENNGSQSPLLECGLKSSSGNRSNRIVIVESNKLNGTAVGDKLTPGDSGVSATGASSSSTAATLTVDETSANKLRRTGATKRVKEPAKSHHDTSFRVSDWDFVNTGSKDMLLTRPGNLQLAMQGRTSPEPGPSRLSSAAREKERIINELNRQDDEEEEEEEESHYVYMKPRLDLPQHTLAEANLSEVRRNAAREFRERVAPLTRGRAFRHHFQGSSGVGGGSASGSQVSATGMVPLSTFFKQLPTDQDVATSSSMEFNPFAGNRWRLPDASPFVRNMTTRSVRYNNRRGRRQTSFEGTASSSRDDFDHVTGPATASATSVVAGMDSEFGSGTIGGGSIDTYTGMIEKMLCTQVSQPPGTVPAATLNRVNDAMIEYIRYIKQTKQKVPKKYYKLPFGCCGWRKEWKVSMDRLQLLALFDRDTGWFQVLLAIVLTALVAALGSTILQMGFYADILAFIFCFVMAGSQYSLLKSVQPDAASPIHGFNKMVAFSRPIYFCLCAGLLIGVQRLIEAKEGVVEAEKATPLILFGLSLHSQAFFHGLRYGLETALLFFPLLFSLGLFPQINTFFVYFLEQMDMHVFGGNAVCGLAAGFVGIAKSILACFILYGLVYGGVIEPKGTQHISFSIFCAVLIPITFHMSRCASDFTNIWTLIKSSLVMMHSEDEEEEQVPAVGAAAVAGSVKRSRSGSEVKLKDTIEDQSEAGQSLGGIDAGKSSISLQPLPMTATNSQMSVLGGDPMTGGAHQQQRSDSTTTNSSLSYMLRDGDPLPRKLQKTVNARLKHDLLVCIFMAIVVMALHCSTIFTVLQPEVNPALHTLAVVLGFVLHYLFPQMRKQWPWLCVSKPILKAADFGQYEAKEETKVSWFESMYVYLCFLERNVLYPVLFMSALTGDSPKIVDKFGPILGAAVIVVCGLKGLRNAYSDTASQYLIVIFTVLFFQVDSKTASETFLVDYFLVSILYRKISEFLLKLQFIVTYIAPWQITWGSAFHAFAQPFSVPHSAMLFVQAGVSAILSTPLNPFLGSAIFITSYVRPIKFWERDYNTRRIDHSNTRLSLQLERDLGADDNNLNSIFYEHLTQSLQHSLCGDLVMGRWGQVSQGDCFVLASDYLNCLVHIIELGNGLCTFQIRGLEFRGTYCQQREVEAISEGIEDNIDCCCCAPGHIKNLLSVNAMFSARWLAWQVVAAQYVIEGYSISDNSATTLLTVYEFRRALITYYVKSCIFFVIRSGKLEHWLKSEAIQEALQMTVDPQFVDLDPAFNQHLDEDFDSRVSGITRTSFCMVYLEWIKYCYEMRRKEMAAKEEMKKEKERKEGTNDERGGGDNERAKNVDVSALVFEAIEKPLVSLCFALTLLARRTLATASHGRQYSNFEFFLHGLHALFKGDFRITSPRDEWVFADMDLLHQVVAPAVRMSLKLHQDYFQNPEQFEDITQLYTTICYISSEIVISHEADPAWRSAVLRGVNNLLALRHVNDDGGDEYRIIRLTKGFLSFRVIKLNRECVRGLWSGQQQELIYLRNRNPERGSIQNAKQALRNIINSSCDQPIGYPIYVSPLTTSYAETNEQLSKIIGGPVSFEKMQTMFLDLCRRIRNRCQEGCSSGSSLECDAGDMQGVYCAPNTPSNTLATIGSSQTAYGSQSLSLVGGASGGGGAGGPGSAAANRGSLASMGKPYNSSLAGFLRGDRDSERDSGRSSNKNSSKRSDSRSERRATLPASTSNLNTVTSKSEMIMMMGLSSGSGASGSGVAQPGHSGTGKDNNATTTAESSSLTLNTSSNNFLNMNRAPHLKSLSFESKRGPVEREANNRAATSSDLSLPLMMPSIDLNRKVIIVDAGEIYDCLDLGRRIDVNWPSDEMRACGGRSSWRDWSPQVGMIGYVVHYWQPNHPDVFFRSNVNRTLLLLQIGKHFVPVGENGVKEYHPRSEARAQQTVSAENLNGLTRRQGRGSSSRSRKFSDSIRKLKSEEDPVILPVVVLPEEERGCDSGKDEENEEKEVVEGRTVVVQEEVKSEERKPQDVINVTEVREEERIIDPLTLAAAQMDEQQAREASGTSSSSANLDEELARVRD